MKRSIATAKDTRPDNRARAPPVHVSDNLPSRLPVVMVVSYGIDEHRADAVKALESAYSYFGGDCVPVFYLVTDDVSSIHPLLNPLQAKPRLTADADAFLYGDILSAIKGKLENVDYIFYVDSDSRFSDWVSMIDVGADLMGVQHPMFPRDEWAFCDPYRDGEGICRYPFERNAQSHAYIPKEIGKDIIKGTYKWSNGRNQRYMVTTAHYFQSGFWGGRAKYVRAALEEMEEGMAADRDAGTPLRDMGSEKYFNHYMWKHSSDPQMNMRVLGHSFQYPSVTRGFGPWVLEKHEPLIVHKNSFNWQMDEQVEIAAQTGQCLDLFMKPFLGLYGCHHGGRTQSWIYSGQIIATGAETVRRCLSAKEAKAGQSAKLIGCEDDSGLADTEKWTFSKLGHIQNVGTGMCLDVTHKPPHGKEPTVLKPCDDANVYQKFLVGFFLLHRRRLPPPCRSGGLSANGQLRCQTLGARAHVAGGAARVQTCSQTSPPVPRRGYCA